MYNGKNFASPLGSFDNAASIALMGTRISSYVIRNFSFSSALPLFLSIDSDVDLCGSISYICDTAPAVPTLSDSAVDGVYDRHGISPPKIVTFNGFCKGGVEYKLPKDLLQCVNRSELTRGLMQSTLSSQVAAGRQAIAARFLRHLRAKGIDPSNTGMNAGLITHSKALGTPAEPLLFSPETADSVIMNINDVIREMPHGAMDAPFIPSANNGFMHTHDSVTSVLRRAPEYSDYATIGDCAGCPTFSAGFNRMPRGLLTLTDFCTESMTMDSGGSPCVIYPILFGRRFSGTKASIRVETSNYTEDVTDSVIFRIVFYWHIHTFDPRYLGLAWVKIEVPEPVTAVC